MCEHYMNNEQFLFSKLEFRNAKSKDKLPFKCAYCGETCYKSKDLIERSIDKNRPNIFCSAECWGKYRTKQKTQIVKCAQCGKERKKSVKLINQSKSENHFCSKLCYNNYQKLNQKLTIIKCAYCGKECEKKEGRIKRSKSGNNFCSPSCAGKYLSNNRLKTKPKGNTRSKLELHLQNILEKKYLNLNIEYNDRKTLDGLELDIYIPSLNLAFELNGIFHYQPIFSEDKFQSVLDNDARKQQLCQEKKINLCVIDVSSQGHFTIKSSQKYVDDICFIIDKRLEQLNQQGIEIDDVKIVKKLKNTKYCKICGLSENQHDHQYCSLINGRTSRRIITLIKMGFDESSIGSPRFNNEIKSIYKKLYSDYILNKMSFMDIKLKYDLLNTNTKNLKTLLKLLEIIK